jgi:RNA polymerase sigma-54 factor
MALELKQHIKLTQQLVMTPQLQQAIKLLQLSRMELLNVVQQELVENPCLDDVLDDEDGQPEAGEGGGVDAAETPAADTPTTDTPAADAPAADAPDEEPLDAEVPEPTPEQMVGDVDWENYMEARPIAAAGAVGNAEEDRPSLEDNLTPRTSLADHLIWQIGFTDLDRVRKEVALLIVGNLSDDGYLEESLEAIAEAADVELAVAEAVLREVQEMDPVGVAARSLSECLLIQARVHAIQDVLVLRIMRDHLDALQRRDLRGIARVEGVSVEEVAAAANVISRLEPRPGRQFAGEEPVYITPDIFVYKVADEYHVVLNEDGMPKLRVSATYRDVLHRKNDASKETRDYVRDKLRSAVWLIKSIHQRQRTIAKVMHSIIRFQREFFDKGSEFLRPLNLRDVAEDIGMHESTVSRVTTKEQIREIIRGEDPRQPLSDQRIAGMLRVRNISIARRTVTKYREALRILSSTRRRKIG